MSRLLDSCEDSEPIDRPSHEREESVPSEQYLSGVEVELRLHEIVSAYDVRVSEFYCWLERRLREVFEVDIREEENLRHQIREQPKDNG